jgi:uncharacterized protein (TIGR01244 family)
MSGRGRQLGRTLLTLLLLCGVGGISVGCQHTVGRNVAGIGNFALVDDDLYRGAQPTREGIESLKRQGVKTVINLRDDADPAERQWVESAGMRYVQIPSNASRVEPAKVREFLDEVKASPRSIFVHCLQGRDRTGLDVAVYRMVEQTWPREAALKELYAHGYNWPFFPGIARYIRTFDPEVFGADPDKSKGTHVGG